MIEKLNQLLERVILKISGKDPNKYGMRPGAMKRLGLKPMTSKELELTKGKRKAAKKEIEQL